MARGLILLNDSTSGDGAMEFAVLRASDRIQVESITFGWLQSEDAKASVAEYLSALADGSRCGVPSKEPTPNIPHPDGSCRHCA